MSRVAVPKCAPLDFCRPGPWWSPLSGELSPMIKCPNDHKAFLTRHDIAADGSVSPSVVCPDDTCTWHVYVKLTGWDQGHRPHAKDRA